MGYKALYRMYRPRTFDEVAGQQHIVKTLQNTVNQNKIAHAYLFCGPRGTGKTSIAKLFAKAVNCTNAGNKPCLTCEHCLSLEHENHPDIVEIDAASNNGVDEVRDLIEKVKYAPIEMTYKVYIIDEVHMMSTGAFNALLKTIEEPPSHVIFILATTEPHKVIPTIISRCQRYDFTKVSTNEMKERIQHILKEEEINCDEEVIDVIAKLADGGMRDALSILDQCIAYANNNITMKDINQIYGIVTMEEKIDILKKVFEGDASSLVESINRMSETGTDMKRLTTDLMEILKESVMFEYTKDSSLLQQMNQEQSKNMITYATSEVRLEFIDQLLSIYEKYRNAANITSYFEVSMLKMMVYSNRKKEVVQQEDKVVVSNTNIVREPIIEVKPDNMDDTTPQNVSRETFEDDILEIEEEFSFVEQVVEAVEDTKSVKKIELDKEFILQLLVGANKESKHHDMISFNRLDDYKYEIKWAKLASLFKSANIMASANQYVVLSLDNQAIANEINAMDKNNEILEFSKVLFGIHKKVFAVSNEQKQHTIQMFVERQKANTLPNKVEFPKFEIEEEKETSEIDNVLDLFGEENITILED